VTIQNFDKFVDKILVKQGEEAFEQGKVSSLEELEQGFRQLIQQAEFYPKALESQKEVLKLAEREEILAFFTRLEGEKDDDLHLSPIGGL